MDGKKAGELEVIIGEKQYSKEEIRDVFERSAHKVEALMLGENKSLDEIRKPLNLITKVPGEPVDVSWELSRYDVMNVYGELQQESLDEEKDGVLVTMQAYLTYTQNEEWQSLHEITGRLYPPKQTGSEKVLASIQEEISKKDAKSKTKDTIKLPEKVEQKQVVYRSPMDFRGLIVFAMGIITAILLVCLDEQNKKKEVQKKGQQMMLDYPEIINKLNLLLGAGMTVKSAWRKIVTEYESGRDKNGMRFAYEEMLSAYREMQSGVTEMECYERFGRRCGLQSYLKLGALLSQNLRKGTKGLTSLLKMEAIHAFEERKALAKRQGEEAGTKLLLPMFLMLGIVLVIVVVPAFLSIQL